MPLTFAGTYMEASSGEFKMIQWNNTVAAPLPGTLECGQGFHCISHICLWFCSLNGAAAI